MLSRVGVCCVMKVKRMVTIMLGKEKYPSELQPDRENTRQ